MLQLLYTLEYCVSALFHGKCMCISRTMCFVYLRTCTHDNLIYKFSDDNLVIQRHVSGARGEGSFWQVGVAGVCKVYAWGTFASLKYRLLLRCVRCPSAYFYNSLKREASMQTICLQTVTVIPWLYFLLLSPTHALKTLSMWGLAT